MDLRGSKSVVGLLLIILVVVTITGSVVAESTVYGLPVSEGVLLFGNGTPDHDNQPFTQDQLDGIETPGGTTVNETLNEATIKWDQPPKSVGTWNKNNFEAEIENTRPSDESIAPEGAAVTDSSYIKHAHGTIHSIDSSTIAHYNNRSERYIRTNGTVRSQVDFLVNVPENRYDSNPPGDNVLSKRWEYTLEQAEVTRYELRVDGEVVDQVSDNTGVGTHRSGAAFDFEDIPDDAETVSINARIESRIGEEITTRVRVFYTDDDGDRQSRIETRVTNNVLRDSVVVTDEREVTVEQFDATKFEVFKLPDGSTTTVIDTPQIFSRFEIGGETPSTGFWGSIFGSQENTPPDEIRTSWTFMTTRDTGWDQATKAVENGDSVDTETLNTSALPIERRVFPSGGGPKINRTSDDDVAFPSKVEVINQETYPEPELPDGTSAYISGNYSTQTALRTTHLRTVIGKDVEIYGLVDDRPYIIPEEEVNVREVEKGNLTVTVEEVNMSRERPTTATITLRSESDNQTVNYNDVGGYVYISDFPTERQIDLGNDGTATVRTNTTGTIEARYEPPAWTGSARPLTGDTDFARSFSPPSPEGIAQWIYKMTVRLLPLFLVLYVIGGYRKMMDTAVGTTRR